MILFQLWAGVVLAAISGLLCASNCVRYAKGRYVPEERGNQVENAVFGIFRWMWAVTYAVAAVFSFIAAAWLTRYILSLPPWAAE
jgi:hypothetical protein